MSTELQRQVQTLKSKQITNVVPIQNGRPSLFHTSKEAASIDIDDIFDLANHAIQSLEQYDSRFTIFRDTLLHPNSIQIRRELKTTQENNELNKEIENLLILLTVYINNKLTHQVLEYLIRRYRINEMNVDAYITCLLPIHDTKVSGLYCILLVIILVTLLICMGVYTCLLY